MADGIELGKAYVQIVPSAKGIKDSIAEELGGESARAGESAGQLFTGKLVGTIKTVLGTAAIGKMISDSVNAGGALQQSLGGIETLFKDIADKVKTYAAQAYKTAGLSANDYMESTTSFAASLLSSVSQDTDAAAQLANMAMVDMSDNANKMGASMQDIQNAYQGFAKQNYTMLDNLKLGYGGTASEMARLINDSGVLGDTVEVTADTVNDVSFDKIIEAIHVIQDNMDITGTTAKEASTTIQGSIGMMKSAWTNFLTGMADPDQDFDALLGNLVDSVVTVADNLIPRITATLPRIVQGISKLIQSLAPHIPPLLEQLIPALIKGAIQIVAVLIKDLPNILKSLGIALRDSVKLIFESLGGNDTFSPFINGFKKELKSFQENYSGEIEGIKDTWENHLKPAFDAIVTFVQTVLLPAFEFVFKTGIVPVVQTAFDAIKQLWTGTLKPVLDGICDFLTGVFTGDWKRALQGILNIWTGTFNALKTVIMAPLEYVKNRINACVEYIQEKFKFNWELPKLKLPHFNISGSFSFNPPKVPKFSVDWYKKAMDDPMIMDQPTAFGINRSGQIMAGGEAGSEVVSGTDTLMGMIKGAVSSNGISKEDLYSTIVEALIYVMKNYGLNLLLGIDADTNAMFKNVVLKNNEFKKMHGGQSAFA